MLPTPLITSLRPIPVAGRDSMLLNLSGAHGPHFTRNLLVLHDSSGHVGVGEVPGGEAIRQVLEDAAELVVGEPVGAHLRIVQRVRSAFADRDSSGRGVQTFDQRTAIHAVTAIETALLDLLGQHLGVPLADLLGEGRQRDSVPVLGYLFYVGDRQRTALPYAEDAAADNFWFRLRHEAALTPDAIVRLAKAAHDRYGFQDFKLKGGVFSGEAEIEAMSPRCTKPSRGPASRSTRTAPGRWPMRCG